jgi:hypothetical protein
MIAGALYGVFAFAVFFCVQLVFIRLLAPSQWLVWNKRCVVVALVIVLASGEDRGAVTQAA